MSMARAYMRAVQSLKGIALVAVVLALAGDPGAAYPGKSSETDASPATEADIDVVAKPRPLDFGENVRQQNDEFADEFDNELEAAAGFPDPFENANRKMLVFNQGLERWVLDPVTTVYRFVLPSFARKSILRFLVNFDSPAVFANDLMQREWRDAGITAGRFGINSTIGIGGLFDPALYFGLEPHTSDFGQTLALEGVPSGAYLIVPLFGPYTVRDGVGDIVDIFLRPITFFLGPIDQIFYATIYGGSSGIALHDAHGEELDMLEESSVDFYAALRNAYYQNRTAEIWARRADHESLTEVAMDYWNSDEEVEIRADAR